MKEFIFCLFSPKQKKDGSFLEARIRKIQEEGFEGTDKYWYEIEVGYPKGENIKHFSELRSVWNEKLGYNELKRATTSLHEAIKKLKRWCKGKYSTDKNFPNYEIIFLKSQDRNYSPVLNQ